ncbi:hypothetical protein IWW48_005499 [Coemansia sp. RSA 1200]|nr:hypothetical protein IWW48_005499 [Coemansia sp. RSA 1200]
MLRVIQSFTKLQITAAASRGFATTAELAKAKTADSRGAKPGRKEVKSKAAKKKTAKASAKKAAKKPAKKAAKKPAKELSPLRKMLMSKRPLLDVPKSPPSNGYAYFLRDQYKAMANSGGKDSIPEFSRKASLKWKQLGESEHTKYVNIAKAGLAQHEKDMLQWWKTVDHRKVDLENKRRRRINREIRDKIKAGEPTKLSKFQLLKDPHQPKMPATNYIMFAQEKLAGQSPDPSLSLTERNAAIARIWRSMSQSEKAPYTEAYSVELAAYKDAMTKYRNSIAIGH